MLFKYATLSTFVVAALAAPLAAPVPDLFPQLPDLPDCALTCLVQLLENVGCGLQNTQCLCAHHIQVTAQPCVANSCSSPDAASAFSPSPHYSYNEWIVEYHLTPPSFPAGRSCRLHGGGHYLKRDCRFMIPRSGQCYRRVLSNVYYLLCEIKCNTCHQSCPWRSVSVNVFDCDYISPVPSIVNHPVPKPSLKTGDDCQAIVLSPGQFPTWRRRS